MFLPQRKPNRLKGYDYSQNGLYFLTICTHDRLHLFGEIRNGRMHLNDAGIMVQQTLSEMPQFYPYVQINIDCIMPNHLHVIMAIDRDLNGTPQEGFPTLSISESINRFKTLTTRLYIEGVHQGIYPAFEKRIWQKSFYDHIIRNENEFRHIFLYIKNNPRNWREDEWFKLS